MRTALCIALALGALFTVAKPATADADLATIEGLVFPVGQPTLPVLKWRRPPALTLLGPIADADRKTVDRVLSLGLQAAQVTAPAPGPGGPQLVIIASHDLVTETERRLRAPLMQTRAGDPARSYAHLMERIANSPGGCTSDLVVDIQEIRAFFLFIDLENPSVDVPGCLRRALLSTFNIRAASATDDDIRATIKTLYHQAITHGDDRDTLLRKIASITN